MTFPVRTNNTLTIQQTRTYHRFSDAADDVVNGRVYEGIHFRFSDMVARMQGMSIAEWTFKHFLRPLHDSHGDDDED